MSTEKGHWSPPTAVACQQLADAAQAALRLLQLWLFRWEFLRLRLNLGLKWRQDVDHLPCDVHLHRVLGLPKRIGPQQAFNCWRQGGVTRKIDAVASQSVK